MTESLAWDTDFFGYKIGLVKIGSQSTENLQKTIQDAKDENYELLYFFLESKNQEIENFLVKKNASLVDNKVIFQKVNIQNELSASIDELKEATIVDQDALLQLAYEAGKFSRFKVDSQLAPKFESLYSRWLQNSLNKTFADFTLYIQDAALNTPISFITGKIKNNVGTIGLVATDYNYQGKGLGKKIITAAEQKFYALAAHSVEVATQLDNEQACAFYAKCGYTIKSVTPIYHYWIK